MKVTAKQLMDKLEHMESDLKYLKEHMADVDLVLTEDDLEALEEAEKDLKAGKTKRIN